MTGIAFSKCIPSETSEMIGPKGRKQHGMSTEQQQGEMAMCRGARMGGGLIFVLLSFSEI